MFVSILKSHGQSITASRIAVFDTLLGQEPMSMRELVSRAHTIDRASVYRVVSLFERLGIVQRLNIGWKYKLELSGSFTSHHHHLTCMKCGKVVALREEDLEDTITAIACANSFTVESHQIEIQGLCPDCQQTA